MYRLTYKHIKTRNVLISQTVLNHKGRPYYAVIDLESNEWYIVDAKKRVKKFEGVSANKVVRHRTIRRYLIKLGVKLLYKGRTKASEKAGKKLIEFNKARKQQLKEQENESQKTSESVQDNPTESV